MTTDQMTLLWMLVVASALPAFSAQPEEAACHVTSSCDAVSDEAAKPADVTMMLQAKTPRQKSVQEEVGTSTLGMRTEQGYRVHGHTALGRLTVHGVPADAEGTCSNASVALQKIKELDSELLKSKGASEEEEELGKDLADGENGEDTLREMEDALDEATLVDGLKAGELITMEDMNHIVECETGVASVRLMEHEVTGTGEQLIQGDMGAPSGAVLVEVQEAIKAGRRWAGKPFAKGTPIKWCSAPGASVAAKKAWNAAVKALEKQVPCLKFAEVQATSANLCAEVPSIVLQTAPKDGCWSFVGDSANAGKSQPLNLGQGCETTGIALHEIGHALGMAHEQSRPDRAKYVSVHYDNINSDGAGQFDIEKNAYVGTPYDVLSLMHYAAFDFSVNGKPTIEVQGNAGKDAAGLTQSIGQRMGFSELDIEHIGEMYGCPKEVKPIMNAKLTKALSEKLALKAKTSIAPVTKDGCLCKPKSTKCATSVNGQCCNSDADPKGAWCRTEGSCMGYDWDYCEPRPPTPPKIAPTTKKGCTCRNKQNPGATKGNGYCFNSDKDPIGAWCFTEGSCMGTDWDRCTPATR